MGRRKVDRAREMLHRMRNAFAADPKNPDVTPLVEVEIETGANAPVAAKARKWSVQENEHINKTVQGLLEKGQIEPSMSPWAANPVLVKQGDKLRFCIDYRALNLVTRKDSHGIGNIDDMLLHLHGVQLMSSLDLASGYYQLKLAKSAAPKTAFRTASGSLWQWKVAPFGLVNLPAIFTRLMHSVLGAALGVHALIYIDDILVFSTTFEDHLDHLEDVLTRIIKANLSCSLPKTKLFRVELDFLGHEVGAAGKRPSPNKVKAMIDMGPPCKDGKPDLTMVQSLLGIFNYYRDYIPRFAEISAPIADLTRKDVPMVWTEERDTAFK